MVKFAGVVCFLCCPNASNENLVAQEYYANTGALKAAAQAARGGRAVGCSIVETFGKDPKPRELEVIFFVAKGLLR